MCLYSSNTVMFHIFTCRWLFVIRSSVVTLTCVVSAGQLSTQCMALFTPALGQPGGASLSNARQPHPEWINWFPFPEIILKFKHFFLFLENKILWRFRGGRRHQVVCGSVHFPHEKKKMGRWQATYIYFFGNTIFKQDNWIVSRVFMSHQLSMRANFPMAFLAALS